MTLTLPVAAFTTRCNGAAVKPKILPVPSLTSLPADRRPAAVTLPDPPVTCTAPERPSNVALHYLIPASR